MSPKRGYALDLWRCSGPPGGAVNVGGPKALADGMLVD